MPFEQGLAGDLQTIEGFHVTVLEVKTSSVIGEFFGVNFLSTETTPGEEGATGGNAEGPEVGSGDKILSDRLRVLVQVTILLSRENTVSPESHESDPTGVTVDGFEVVVISPTECGVCASQDEAEHGAQNVGSDKVGEGGGLAPNDVIASCDNGVHDIPNDGCGTSTTVCATIMEDLRETAAKPKGSGVGARNSNLVDEVDEVLLTEEESNHEIGRSSGTDVWCRRPSFVASHENNERNKVGEEDDSKSLAIIGKEDV